MWMMLATAHRNAKVDPLVTSATRSVDSSRGGAMSCRGPVSTSAHRSTNRSDEDPEVPIWDA